MATEISKLRSPTAVQAALDDFARRFRAFLLGALRLRQVARPPGARPEVERAVRLQSCRRGGLRLGRLINTETSDVSCAARTH